MKTLVNRLLLVIAASMPFSCADNTLDFNPLDDNFPLQIVLDADEGGDLADAEDYSVEIQFEDRLPGVELPNQSIILHYEITDTEKDMIDAVVIDEVVYEVELNDCVYERELSFTAAADGLSGTITLAPDADLETVPESFEVVFTLPGLDETEGSFTFTITSIDAPANVLLGAPVNFEYEVLDNDAAGEWELELTTEEEFEAFQEVFGSLYPGLEDLSFSDITGKVYAEFEYEEMTLVLELTETEEVTECEDGETETETENKVLELEAEYEAEDGELALEGSHFILSDDGEIKDELDYFADAAYSYNEIDETMAITFLRVVDEDNFKEGEELFASTGGITFLFVRN